MNYLEPNRFVLIGASTGGPGQIQKIISSLNKLEQTTIVIAQHMAEEFLPSFIKRLQESSENTILLAKDAQMLQSGCIYFCNAHTRVVKNNSKLCFTCEQSSKNSYNPNINVLFNSFVPFANTNTLCVILTGIGDDGVLGCKNLSLGGARTITESKESAIVDGMPSRARESIASIEIKDMQNIIQSIKEFSL